MNVDYKFYVGGKEIVVSQDCKGDKDIFKFVHHMEEVFGNTNCERDGESSPHVKLSVRKATDSTGKKEYEYFEMVCYDPSKPKCHFAKRQFGTPEEDAGSLFPKNKTADGKWQPWTKFDKESGKEE